MTSRWLPSLCLSTLAILSTIRACDPRIEVQLKQCICEESPSHYSQITCSLPNKKMYTITMNNKNQYEIDCQNNYIENVDLIPALLERNRTIDYYGYNNCSTDLFQSITDKLLAHSRNIRFLEFKYIQKFHGFILEGYRINSMHIEKSFMNELPHDLLKYVPTLTSFFVNYNKYLVTIPESLFAHTHDIEVIDLGSNNLNYLPDRLFANLTKLKQIRLFGNQLTSVDEQIFDNLPSLNVVELMTNKLKTLPKSVFSNLTQLHIISLRKNHFETLPEDLFMHNFELKAVQLSDNPFLFELPDKLFANLPALTEVNMQNCNLSSLPENIFSGSTKLKTINLSNNKLKRLSRNLFISLEHLITLSLKQNGLEILEDNIFEDTRRLKDLNLSYNKITVNDFTFNGLLNLVNLSLAHNSLGDLSVRSFKFFQRLENLDMSYNNLTLKRKGSYGIQDNSILPQLDNLRKLNLENNSITSIFSDWNFNLLQLEDLNLAKNKITEVNYSDLQFIQLKTLTVNLENNLITTINLTSAEVFLRENTGQNTAKRIIKLQGNPIHCDCKIYDFIRFLDKTMPSFVYDVLEFDVEDRNNPLSCQSPEKYKGQKLKDINSKDLTCPIHDGPMLPASCSLQHYEYQIAEKRIIVNCSNTGLTKIPNILLNRSDNNFIGQEVKVYLSGNKITSMPGPNMGYENVVELDLSNNFINEITWVPPKIQVLKLDHNNLTYLDNVELSMINHTTIKNVTFHNNPWICNCQLINFTKYLQENFQKIPKLHNITCANTEKRVELTRLTSEDLCPYSTLLIIVICAVLVFAAMITCVLIAMYYRYMTQIKVWLYAHNMCLYLITEEEVDQDKPYDAFISFSHEDEDFVVNELMPGLETGPHPFKLCVHFRDFQPGEFITTNITRSIEASRRTVVVVSKGFLNSEWGKMEFRTAHTEAMKEGRARVIIILYGDLGTTDDLDPEIKAYLSTNTYVKWGSPWFWDSLRYALPHSSKYARIMPSEVVVKQPVPQLNRHLDDKADLIYEPTTPPAATTPPADSLHRLHDPLLTPSALNVSLINGSLVNNLQDKNKQNNNIYNLDV